MAEGASSGGGGAPSRRALVGLGAIALIVLLGAFMGGAEAALHLYPRREFDRTWEAIARARGKNVWLHEDKLADEAERRVVRPNNDTLYSYAAVDMADGPFVITAPGSDRYWSIEFLGETTDVFGYVGSRELGADHPARVLLAPAGYAGTTDGLPVVAAPSRRVWLMARFLASGPDDAPRAARLQEQLTIARRKGP